MKPLTAEAREIILGQLSDAMDYYKKHQYFAAYQLQHADDECTCAEDEGDEYEGCDCDTRDPDKERADAATHAQLALAAAQMANAMSALLAASDDEPTA